MLKCFTKYHLSNCLKGCNYDIQERPSNDLKIVANNNLIISFKLSEYRMFDFPIFNNQQLVVFLLCAGHCASHTSKLL